MFFEFSGVFWSFGQIRFLNSKQYFKHLGKKYFEFHVRSGGWQFYQINILWKLAVFNFSLFYKKFGIPCKKQKKFLLVPPNRNMNISYEIWKKILNLLYFATGIVWILKHWVTDVTLERACGSVGLSIGSGLCHADRQSFEPRSAHDYLSEYHLPYRYRTYFEFTLLFYTLWRWRRTEKKG